MRIKSILSIFMLFSTLSYAGITDTVTVDSIPPVTWENGWSIAGSAGSMGFGVAVAKKINPHFNVRSAFTTYTFEAKDEVFEDVSDSVAFDITTKFGGIPLLVDFTPKKHGWFRITGGIYFNTTSIEAVGRYTEDIVINDITLEGSRSKIGVKWEAPKVTPYLGLGFGRTVPKNNRVGFSFEVGALYIGEPDIEIISTGLLEPTAEANEENIEDAIITWKFWPVMQMALTVKLF